MKIGEKIAIGQGPNEMIHPFFINADDSLRLFDPMKSIIYIYSYDDFILKMNEYSKKVDLLKEILITSKRKKETVLD